MKDIRDLAWAEKDVLTGRIAKNQNPLSTEKEIEEGSPLVLVLKSKQDKDVWDNLDNLPSKTLDEITEKSITLRPLIIR